MAFDCSLCGKSYKRAEHLRRHWSSIHERRRPFECTVCNTLFGRADSLRRHHQIHRRDETKSDEDSVASMEQPAPAPRQQSAACQPCALAKTRCTKDMPCIRCLERRSDCVYTDTAIPPQERERINDTANWPDREHVLSAEDDSDRPSSDDTIRDDLAMDRRNTQHFAIASSESINVLRRDEPSSATAVITASSQHQVLDYNIALTGTRNINWIPVDDDLNLFTSYNTAFQTTPAINWQQSLESMDSIPSVSTTTESTCIAELAGETRHQRRKRSPSLYVEGYGWRLSAQKAPRLTSQTDHNLSLSSEDLAFPDIADPVARLSLTIDAGVYSTIALRFQQFCCAKCVGYASYQRTTFPTILRISYYVSVFLERSDPHFPLMHRQDWGTQSTRWISVLAAATVGSTFVRGPMAWQCMNAFREFLRRAIFWCLELQEHSDPLSVAQASILHVVVQSTANAAFTVRQAVRLMNTALDWYKTTHVVYPFDQIDPAQQYLRWQVWIAQESHHRLLWFAWLCEMQVVFFRNSADCASLPTGDLILPSTYAAWTALTPGDWETLLSSSPTPLTLHQALYTLYIEHEAPQGVDSLHQILLTYAILARTDEIKQLVRWPLRNYVPVPASDHEALAASKEDLCLTPGHDAIWLPANSQYASWRNGACDALDNLHWLANRDSAASKGREGAATLHLHVARLIILCPCHDFVKMADKLAEPLSLLDQALPPATQLEPNISKWLVLDDHKGRLSLVHAGAIMWHVRRYSLGQYYEVFAVFVAVLSIWVYGTYFDQVRGVILSVKKTVNRSQQEESHTPLDSEHATRLDSPDISSDDSDQLPTTILLDRPCDDEIVQAFVRRGFDMTAELSGIGNICTPSCQSRLLKEGINLLEKYHQSGEEKSYQYRTVLQRLLRRIDPH